MFQKEELMRAYELLQFEALKGEDLGDDQAKSLHRLWEILLKKDKEAGNLMMALGMTCETPSMDFSMGLMIGAGIILSALEAREIGGAE